MIEGLDGSGKTTQLKLLKDFLAAKKIKTATVDFPQYGKTFFGRLVAAYLKGNFGGVDEVCPYLASLLYAGDRWQAKEKMMKVLRSGKLLLADRYTSANMGFMGAKIGNLAMRERFWGWLKKLEWEVYGIPKPDLIIYLAVSAEVGQKLVDLKGKRKYLGNQALRDIHEQSGEYLQRVAKVFEELCEKKQDWVKIECMRGEKIKPIEEIHQEIVGVLREKRILSVQSS